MSRAPAGKMHAHPDQLPAAHLRIARHGAAAEQGPATSRPAERVLPVTAKIRIMRVQGHALLNPRTRLLMLRRFLHALRIRRSTRSSGLGGACQVPRGRARKMWMPSAAGCRSTCPGRVALPGTFGPHSCVPGSTPLPRLTAVDGRVRAMPAPTLIRRSDPFKNPCSSLRLVGQFVLSLKNC